MDPALLAICKKVNEELQIDRFNERMALIARCFEYDVFLAVDLKAIRTGHVRYWNDYFDQLMNMKLEELQEWEEKMFKITKDYGDYLNRYPAKE